MQIESALRKACRLVPVEQCKLSRPIVYYQTNTLLQYHPQGYRFCVTHHGPFAAHFAQQFSPDLAQLSFGGSQDKVDILCHQQRLGVQRLLRDTQGTVLAHSELQQHILKSTGLNSTRFMYLHPPIGVPPCNDPTILPNDLLDFVRGADILFFTAVARLDYFKNIKLVVQSGLELLQLGVTARTLIVGDPEDDSSRRNALTEMVPAGNRPLFMMCPRLAKDQLHALFAATRGHGVFLCPSRYETLGITPLEAAAGGVVNLVTEVPNVEALAFMPAGCTVPQDASSVAARVQAMYLDGIPVWAERVKCYVRPETSLERFQCDLLRAWSRMSMASAHEPALSSGTRGDQSLQG